MMLGDNPSSSVVMNNTYNSTDDVCRWCLNEELIGPLIAVSTGIILILSLVINLFICVYTLSHPKSLKKSSTMLLLNLALVNLLMTVLFMPFMVVASAAEEWIIGQSDTERDVLCQINAFIFAYTVGVSVHTLAAISFDRFLSIVKPHHHKRYMTWRITLGIVTFIWVSVQNLYFWCFLVYIGARWSLELQTLDKGIIVRLIDVLAKVVCAQVFTHACG